MRLFIKNKLVSIGGTSTVQDEAGNNVFFVKGKLKLFSPTRKKRLYDSDKNKLFTIRRKYWHLFFRSAFLTDQNKNRVKVKRKVSIKDNYIIEGGQTEIRIDGSVFGWNFSIYADSKLIGTVQRQFTVIRDDSFILDIVDDNYAPMLVALVLALDIVTDD